MPRRKYSKQKNYVVGYRRPPKATQFKPGESGNPKGRPKGARPLGSLLQDLIQQKVSVTENGKTRRIAALEVMLRRLLNDAMRSDQRAIKLLLSLIDRYGEISKSAIQFNEMLAEDAEILAQYLQAPGNTEPEPAAHRRDA